MYFLLNLCFVVLILGYTKSKILYLDCVDGDDDSNDIIKTIEQLKFLISSGLGEIDTIKLKNGCSFENSDDVLRFEYEHNLQITNYGNGNDFPILDMSKKIDSSSWQSYGNDIYYVDGITEEVSFVFVGDQRYNLTHYPENALENYFYITEDQNEQTLTKLDVEDAFFDAVEGKDITDVEVAVRSTRWTFARSKLVSIDKSNSQITLEFPEGGPYDKDYGFFLLNKKWMLEFCTECYFYDYIAQRLYLKLNSSNLNPKDFNVSYSKSSFSGIQFFKSDNVIVQNLQIAKSSNTGLEVIGCDNFLGKNLKISNSGNYGIDFQGTNKNVTIDSSELLDCAISGFRGYLYQSKITNNIIQNVFINGVLQTQFVGNLHNLGVGAFVYCRSEENCLMEGNRFLNMGYIGANLGGSNWICKNNYFKKLCFRLDDGAGIYFWGNTFGEYGNHIIQDNMIIDSLGYSFGTSEFIANDKNTEEGYNGSGQGLYADDRTCNSTFSGNVVINAKYGIQIHNSRNNTIENNVIINSRVDSFHITEDDLIADSYGAGWSRFNKVKNNVFKTIPNTRSSYISGSLGWLDMFEELNQNIYHETNFGFDSKSFTDLLSYQNYLETFDFAKEKKWTQNAIKLGNNFESIDYIFTNRSTNLLENKGNFANGNSWKSYPWEDMTHSIIQNATGSYFLKCEINTTIRNIFAYSPKFGIPLVGEKYVLEFDLFSETPNLEFSVIVRRGYDNYEILGLSQNLLKGLTNCLFFF